jgi:tRNA (mo5U34)-methyltransferase
VASEPTAATRGSRDSLLDRARRISWYHTIELAPGLVTEGEFDLRPYVGHYGLPERMEGMRAIDVGTFNGFWAFEMERRGADVVALDLVDADELDWPAFRPRPSRDTPLGEGFRIAHQLLDSSVERAHCSVYEARAQGGLGEFDLVFCGSMLIHLRDQFLALERMCELLRPGGIFLSCEPYDPLTSLLPFAAARYRAHRTGAPVFWEPGIRTWALMIEACGFTTIRRVSRFTMRSPRGYSVRHVVHQATRV